jgi:DNA-binding response OmpR family regulator
LSERRPRALIADADVATRQLLSQQLVADGFNVNECSTGRDALERLAATHFDLVVLDADLSGLDGIALCRAVRQGTVNRNSAVFAIGDSPAESDKVLALANGADDYITKPVGVREFLARVSAVMRRTARLTHTRRDPIRRSGLTLDPARRQVMIRGRIVPCSKQEFDVIYELAASPGIVFSRADLLDRHWPGAAHAADTHSTQRDSIRLVDPIISRLRRKLEERPDDPQLILTVWGIGYKFTE